jgi:hypothetical protein
MHKVSCFLSIATSLSLGVFSTLSSYCNGGKGVIGY